MDSMCSVMEELVGFNGLCFSELMESEVMQQTVWGTELFNMFLHVAYRRSKEQPWRQGRVPEDLQLQRGTNGLLHWDGIMRGTLTAQIASYFGDFTSDTGAQVRRVPNAPWFIRVRFSSRNPNIRFYHDLSLFELRLPNPVEHPTRQRSTFYRCVAIVRLRDSPEGSDTVQLFRPDGMAFRPNGGAFPLSDDCRVHDSGNYMLYFLHTCTPPFPEEPAWSQSIHHPFAASFHLLDTVGMDVLNEAIRKEATAGRLHV
jgi:hypothetical protein